MNDEVKIKISQPMFEVGELERFDNHIHEIIEEYSKMMFKEKDQILTQRIIMKQEEEIERLNNRVKQLEKSIMISNKKHSFMTKDNIKLRTIINELNNAYCKVITKCEEMINNRFYMNDIAIKKYANEIKDICKYYVGEAKRLKGDDKE